jgi:hypothetical protein
MFTIAVGVVAVPAVSIGLAEEFAHWKAVHNKSYGSVEQHASALQAFVENDQIIAATNAQNLSYWLGHNLFSDLTLQEFSSTYLVSGLGDSVKAVLRSQPVDYDLANAKAPAAGAAIDWVKMGAVTPVKNQGQCGSW